MVGAVAPTVRSQILVILLEWDLYISNGLSHDERQLSPNPCCNGMRLIQFLKYSKKNEKVCVLILVVME